MSATSDWILARNKDMARTMFGPPSDEMSEETCEDRYERYLDDEWQAKKLTPLIVGGAAVAILGGALGIPPVARKSAAVIAVALFLGI